MRLTAPWSAGSTSDSALAETIRAAAEPLGGIDQDDLSTLLERVADARVVLLGEASHGTSEFYRMRARITRELVERRGFTIVAVEADWPDAARVDRFVRGQLERANPAAIFGRFPTWMWRNEEVLAFVEWLREHNARLAPEARPVSFYGLDLYSLYDSIGEVLRYLDRVDPQVATVARERYGCLRPFEPDPANYGLAALTDRYRSCEDEVVAMLAELQQRRTEHASPDDRSLLDVEQNARVAASAERYYRAMYHGGADSWNLRDTHMFETLETLLGYHGPGAGAVVWAHNSHLGDASATEMGERGELNVGQLVRERFGAGAYVIGFGTDHGTVAAAHNWGDPVEVMEVRPSRADSYERLCHATGLPAFLLPLRQPRVGDLREQLESPRLERAIGVVYRPETERQSHYFEARLPSQFDEYIWFDETHAVTPLTGRERAPALPTTHPFAPIDV